MSWWPFNRAQPAATLTPEQQQRLQQWQQLPLPGKNTSLPLQRWVVLDSESSGLNLQTDRLLSIAAVGVEHGCIDVAQHFDCRLQQQQVSSEDNILIHGIGADEQRKGQPASDALLDFLHFARRDPLLAFHADFDRTLVERTLTENLVKPKLAWIDLADLCPALFPQLAPGRQTLDDWLAAFELQAFERHNALADAWVTAELFLIVLRHLPPGVRNWQDLQLYAAQQRQHRQLTRGR